MTNLYDNIHDSIMQASEALDKIYTLLNHLSNEYSYPNEPVVTNDLSRETFSWVCGYHAVITYVDMALDYVCDVRENLEQAEKLNTGIKQEGGVVNG